MRDRVRNLLEEVEYGDGELDDGFDYADAEGWDTFDELGRFQSVLSGFSYDDDELADEDLAPWEPVDWDDD